MCTNTFVQNCNLWNKTFCQLYAQIPFQARKWACFFNTIHSLYLCRQLDSPKRDNLKVAIFSLKNSSLFQKFLRLKYFTLCSVDHHFLNANRSIKTFFFTAKQKSRSPRSTPTDYSQSSFFLPQASYVGAILKLSFFATKYTAIGKMCVNCYFQKILTKEYFCQPKK